METAGMRIQIHMDPFHLICWIRIQISVRNTDSDPDVKPEPEYWKKISKNIFENALFDTYCFFSYK